MTATAYTSVLYICLISSLITVSFSGKTLHYLVCTWHYQTKNTCIHSQSGNILIPSAAGWQTVAYEIFWMENLTGLDDGTAVASIVVSKLFPGLGETTLQAICKDKKKTKQTKKHSPTQEVNVSPAL